MKNTAMFISMVLLIHLFGLLSGCKTRQVQSKSTEVHKNEATQTETAVKSSDSSNVTTNTAKTTEGHTEAKTTASSNTEVEADSIVQIKEPGKATKTIIYPKKGTKVKLQDTSTRTEAKDEFEKYLTNQVAISQHTLDSISKVKKQFTLDSISRSKNSQAHGSGETFAYTIPIVAGLILALIVFLGYKYFKRT